MSKPILLHIWPGASGLISSSPFCLKAIYACHFKGLPYKLKRHGKGALPPWIKRETLPAAEVAEDRIEDSTEILKMLDRLAPRANRLYPIDSRRLADTMLLEDWADEHFAHFVVYYRWVPEANYRKFIDSVFEKAPALVKALIAPRMRKSAIQRLEDRGIGHASEETRRVGFDEALWILDQRLEAQEYLTGPDPTAADFAIYPFLQIIMTENIPELAPVVLGRKQIMFWLERMEKYVTPPVSA